MHVIVGLGNPGPEYERTRHNAGFRFVDHLAARWSLGRFRRVDQAWMAEGHWQDHPVRLLKPRTYMNRSGAALTPLRDSRGFDPAAHLLVAVDDVALPLGRFRLRGAGSAGGHNGLKSIEGALRRQDYARLRIGVGPLPPDVSDLADFVLDSFDANEDRVLTDLLDPIADAAECWVEEGIERAMNRFNR